MPRPESGFLFPSTARLHSVREIRLMMMYSSQASSPMLHCVMELRNNNKQIGGKRWLQLKIATSVNCRCSRSVFLCTGADVQGTGAGSSSGPSRMDRGHVHFKSSTVSQWLRPLKAEKKPPSVLSLCFPSCSSPTCNAS